MKAVDTNILVRFLVGDDESQARKVYALFKKAEDHGETFHIPSIVILEMIWVLESVYEIPRSGIIEAIGDLMASTVLQFEQPATIHKFIKSAQMSTIDLSDLLIALTAADHGCETTITFDKKASKFNLFELLK